MQPLFKLSHHCRRLVNLPGCSEICWLATRLQMLCSCCLILAPHHCIAACPLWAQGCSEIRWLATKMGAKAATISGLSGGQLGLLSVPRPA